MKNQSRNLAVMVFVLFALVLAYFGLQAYLDRLEEQEEAEAEALAAERIILETDRDAITAFSYTYEGETYEYVKEDGTWYYVGDRTMTLDQDTVDTFLGAFDSIEVLEDLGELEHLPEFGLEAGYEVITWTTEEGTNEIHIGDYNETLGEYYISLAGDSHVYLQESYFQARFQKTPDYFEAEEEEAETTETAE